MVVTKFVPTPSDLEAIENALKDISASRAIRDDNDSGIFIDPAEVRSAIRARRLRDNFFGSGLLEDPVWDILLDLFAAELEHRGITTSSLCVAASVAPTTALRWITKLTNMGVLQRHADAHDRRRSYIELSESASLAMRRYIAALRREGMSLA
jgi:DNA-binding MarR family transcriptional regulator